LLFERFLNPDRVSLPDIDIDFDDEGRGKVIDYVIDKYGANQVAQIITYGSMAAKSSIRDTARVMELPLAEADRIAKLMPDISLKKLFSLDDKTLKEKLRGAEGLQQVNMIKDLAKKPSWKDKPCERLRSSRGVCATQAFMRVASSSRHRTLPTTSPWPSPKTATWRAHSSTTRLQKTLDCSKWTSWGSRR
jgi:hypothetical protein